MKNMSLLMAALAAACAVRADVAEPLTVAQGETLGIAASRTHSAVAVHGALAVAGGTKDAPVVLTVTEALAVGGAAGDAATVTVGDWGQITMKARPLTIGGGGTGCVTLGGKRRRFWQNPTTGEVFTWDVDVADVATSAHDRFCDATAHHLFCGDIVVPADAAAESGVLDIIRLDPNGALFQNQNSDRIQNLSPNCDARILFNGGFLSDNNGYGASRRLSSTKGRALILESVDGRPITLGYKYGGPRTEPTEGLVKTAGAGDVVVHSATGNEHHFGWQLGASAFFWGHTGHLRLSSFMCLTCSEKNALPCRADGGDVVLDGDNEYNWLDLNGTAQAVNGLTAAAQSIVSNGAPRAATLVLGSQRPDGVLNAPNITAGINVEKVGTGTLTITNTPSFDALAVTAGTVSFAPADVPISLASITAAAGTTLVLDGATVRARAANLDAAATVTYVNGGRLVLAGEADDAAVDFIDGILQAGGVEVEKTGDGTSYLALDAASGVADVHVRAGVLAVARRGTTNEFWRVTIKETAVRGRELNLGPFRLYGEDGTICDGGGTSQSTYSQVANTTAPEALGPKQVMFSSTAYKPAGDYPDGKHGSDYQCAPEVAMFLDSTVNSCRFDFAPLLDAPDTWLVATYRIPAREGAFVTGYNVKSQWDGPQERFPGAWKVESSPSGKDGTWTAMDEQAGQKAPGGQAWYRTPFYPLCVAERPSAGFAPTACVRVDRGATLDCTQVTGRQELSKLAVDLSAGTGVGTLKGVRLAGAGTLNVVGIDGRVPLGVLPLVFAASATGSPLADWKVLLDGVPVEGRRLVWQEAALAVSAGGMALIFR